MPGRDESRWSTIPIVFARQRGHLADRVLPRQHLRGRGRSGRGRAGTLPNARGCWRVSVDAPQSQAIDVVGCSKDLHEVGLGAEAKRSRTRCRCSRIRTTASPAETPACSRITSTSCCCVARQEDAFGAAEARVHRLLGFSDDARALRRIPEARQHRVAAAVLRPRRNHQRAKAGLARQVGVGVRGGVGAALRGALHHREELAGGSLLDALRLHMRDDGQETGLLADRNRLADAGARAEASTRVSADRGLESSSATCAAASTTRTTSSTCA